MRKIDRPFRVSEPVVRGVAVQVLILSIITIVSRSYVPAVVLIIDFFIRSILHPRWSLLALVSRKLIVPVAGFRRKQVIFKPKRFAAFIGLTMSALTVLLFLRGYSTAGLLVISILALFSSLEAFFRFCAGCKIFGLLMKLGLVKEDECPDCVYLDGGGI